MDIHYTVDASQQEKHEHYRNNPVGGFSRYEGADNSWYRGYHHSSTGDNGPGRKTSGDPAQYPNNSAVASKCSSV